MRASAQTREFELVPNVSKQKSSRIIHSGTHSCHRILNNFVGYKGIALREINKHDQLFLSIKICPPKKKSDSQLFKFLAKLFPLARWIAIHSINVAIFSNIVLYLCMPIRRIQITFALFFRMLPQHIAHIWITGTYRSLLYADCTFCATFVNKQFSRLKFISINRYAN